MNEILTQMLNQLDLPRCPHCSVAKPRLDRVFGSQESVSVSGANKRWWSAYRCITCGGQILCASSQGQDGIVTEMYPSAQIADQVIPNPARSYLQQSIDSLHAPAGAVMLAASAVDSMLKVKGLKEGSLYSRIDRAASDHLITTEMAQWAHEVRLDANDQRHADDAEPLPGEDEARKCINFALALADFLFVLPAKVERGRTKPTT